METHFLEHTTSQTPGNTATSETASIPETKFSDLGMSAKVLAAVEASGYTIPTPIQAAAIPVALTGQDVLGIAQTGTGKTASFVLPMICRLETGRARARMPRSLILAPTRELAAQVAQSFEKYGVNHKLDVALLIGGVSMDDQVKKLDRGVDVLIATPGRLLDHFQRGRLMLMGVEILVIDEADRMLDMGFIPDIEKICKLLPPRRQTLFFSATMPPEITRLVDQFLKNPTRIEATRPATTATTITQSFLFCQSSEDFAKRDLLRVMLREDGVRNAIIFCNRKVDVAILLKSMLKHGFNAGALHGDMDQKSRMETLDKFRSGDIKFLVASDVAARGLDIPDVSHVFNYDLPRDSDDYVHRIGRTGRAGREGTAQSIVTHDDLKQLKDIEKMLGTPVVWTGEGATEEDYASAGKRRRGARPAAAPARSGRGPARGADRGGERSRPAGRETPAQTAQGERPPSTPPSGQHGERKQRHAMRADDSQGFVAREGDAYIAKESEAYSDADGEGFVSRDVIGATPPRGPANDSPRAQTTARDTTRHQSEARPERAARPDRAPRPERTPRSERAPRPEGEAQPEPRHAARRPAAATAHPGSGPQPTVSHEPRADRSDVRAGQGRTPHAPQQQRHAQKPRSDRPVQDRSAQDRPVQDRPAQASQNPRSTQSGRAPAAGPASASAAFAGDVPAFMRRTSRPVKTAGD